MRFASRVLFFLIILASIVFAQDDSKTMYFINAGFSVPSAPSEFSDYWERGYSIGGGVVLPRSEQVHLLLGFIHSRFGFNGEKLMADQGYPNYGFQIDGGQASITSITADYKIFLSSRQNTATPYLLAGTGLFHISTRDATISYQGQSESVSGSSETKIGFNAGGGLDIRLNPKMALTLGARIIIGLTEGQSTQYFPLLVGLTFR